MSEETKEESDVPMNELERRRRTLAAIEALSHECALASSHMMELRELGVPASDWLPLLARYAPPLVQSLEKRFGGYLGGFIDGLLDARAAQATNGVDGVIAAMAGHFTRHMNPVILEPKPTDNPVDFPERESSEILVDNTGTYEAIRMKAVIARLFAEGPKLENPDGTPRDDQAPALECVIVLKAGQQINGALSVTPEGTLRLLAANQVQRAKGGPAELVMVEHFFDYEQVADIAVLRKVSATPVETSRIHTAY